VAAFADTTAAPIEGFASSDNAFEETAASATGGVATTLAGSALLRHVENANVLYIYTYMRDPFLYDSPVLLIVMYAEDDSCTLYVVDHSAWPIFSELLGCSIPCLRKHLVVVVF